MQPSLSPFIRCDGIQTPTRGKPTPFRAEQHGWTRVYVSPCSPVAARTDLNRLGSERGESGAGRGVCRIYGEETRQTVGDANANSRMWGNELGVYVPVTSAVANRLRRPGQRGKKMYQSGVPTR
jgi:hypothetical protein